jgi:hypothetical protein
VHPFYSSGILVHLPIVEWGFRLAIKRFPGHSRESFLSGAIEISTHSWLKIKDEFVNLVHNLGSFLFVQCVTGGLSLIDAIAISLADNIARAGYPALMDRPPYSTILSYETILTSGRRERDIRCNCA